jgi:hypothetical protein
VNADSLALTAEMPSIVEVVILESPRAPVQPAVETPSNACDSPQERAEESSERATSTVDEIPAGGIHPAGVKPDEPVLHESRKQPGRRPQYLTKSRDLVSVYFNRIKAVLLNRGVEAAVADKYLTKTRLAHALDISIDTLNLFERGSPRLGSATRDRLEIEFKSGPTREILVRLTTLPTEPAGNITC